MWVRDAVKRRNAESIGLIGSCRHLSVLCVQPEGLSSSSCRASAGVLRIRQSRWFRSIVLAVIVLSSLVSVVRDL